MSQYARGVAVALAASVCALALGLTAVPAYVVALVAALSLEGL